MSGPRHFLVIGGQRCGTTYLHRCLDTHPDITMARPARPEPKVFLSPESTVRGLEWYRETYFPHATTEAVLGEKSAGYLETAAAADRAAAMLGEADILVVLRDPIERAVSNWRFSTENGLEQRRIDVALADNLTGPTAWDPRHTSVSPYAYLERGRYADHLGPWLAAFPGRVHVRFYEELVGDASVVAGLFEVLGVDPDHRPPLGRTVNRSEEPTPGLDPDLVDRLSRYFAESDAMLRRLLNRELPWHKGIPAQRRGREQWAPTPEP